ncbi:hypothetical protein [Proteiniphilum sp. UBA5375]|uniref:hypothetical protein n=1 Tax=Proteiniphilum sp. UBA5375 TaxID=1947278 RepID=UPI00257944B0|nr:hypothetical protein [Proteiniphilum sp. UBA5375]
MKPVQFILLTTLMCLWCASSCKKNEPKVWTELPPATQTRENTIGCLVNGELWATGKLRGSFKFPAMKAEYRDYGDEVHLDFYAGGNGGSIGFVVVNPHIGKNEAKVACSFDMIPGCTVMLYPITNLTITKMDLGKGILSGLFAFDVPCSEDTDKVLHITEGRFDLYMTVLIPQN